MNEAIDPVDVSIGGRIRARREELRITQAQLAAGAGVTFQQIQKYERGVNRVSASRLLRIASVLKTTGAALLGELEGPEGEELAIAQPGAAELLTAYRDIRDSERREALLTLAKGLRS